MSVDCPSSRTMFRSIVALTMLALAGSIVALPQSCDPLFNPSCNANCIGAGETCTDLGTLTCCPGTHCNIDVLNDIGVSCILGSAELQFLELMA
jgi:hypothetical protein